MLNIPSETRPLSNGITDCVWLGIDNDVEIRTKITASKSFVYLTDQLKKIAASFVIIKTRVRLYNICLIFSTFSPYISSFVQYLSYLLNVSPYVSSFVQYLSYLLNVSPYVSSFVQYLSYLLNVSPYVSSFVQYLSCLLSVSPYVSSFVQYLSYLLSVSPYVSSFVQYLSYLFNVSPVR